MARHASLGVSLVALLTTSCYVSHRISDPPDGAARNAPPFSTSACCLSIRCGAEAACGDEEECAPSGCEAACEGAPCAGACCALEELCIDGACVSPGASCRTHSDCSASERCDPVGLRCVPTPRTACIEPRPFDPVVRWEDTGAHVISVPLVVSLDGDSIPDIVALTVPHEHGSDRGSLVAFSGDDGRRLWQLGDMFFGACSHTTLAAGDIDGDGEVEIAFLARRIESHVHHSLDPSDPIPCLDFAECGPFPPDRGPDHVHDTDPRHAHVHEEARCSRFADPASELLVVSRDGVIERSVRLPRFERRAQMDTISVADLDADGSAELIVNGTVVGVEGIRWSDPRLAGVGIAVGDLDRDGLMELVTAQHAFEHDGTLLWSIPDADVAGHPAIADVVRDPVSRGPQVVVVDGRTVVVRDGATGEALLGPLRHAAGISSGPPTIADFDGDGRSEIGVMADHAYVLIDPDLAEAPHIRWSVVCDDRTPGTVGSSAFDFDADGAADVVYSDECHVRILSGRDGAVLWARSNPSRTVWEYPVVADVDADGAAELVVASNLRFGSQVEENRCSERAQPYRSTPGGLRVFEDRLESWVGTRPLWNQHGYHVDNVLDDGGIPVAPPRSWESHNTWRANPRYPDPRDVHLPNLIVTAIRVEGATCGDDVSLRARVENRGSRGAEAGARIMFRAGASDLGSVATSRVLFPGGVEWLTLPPVHRTRIVGELSASTIERSPCALAGSSDASLVVECAPR